jgi:uncharacterized membrane protein
MNIKSKQFQIRFNTVSTCEEDRWRLITDGEEILVSNIVVDGHTSTSKDWMQDIKDYKWHISCEGYVSIKNNVAYIVTIKEESVMTRHILKTLSYRIVGTIVTVVTAYSLGMSFEISSLLGVGELMIKPILYFFHERVWYKHIRIGNKK